MILNKFHPFLYKFKEEKKNKKNAFRYKDDDDNT